MRVVLWSGSFSQPMDEMPQQADGALDRLREAVREGSARRGEVLVTPELCLASDASGELRAARAQLSDGPDLAMLPGLARASSLNLVAGYLEACSGRVHSAAVAVRRDGQAIANYRRAHVDEAEEAPIAQGAWLVLVPFEDRIAGLLMSYDLMFPEMARALVLAGADHLVVLARPGSMLGARVGMLMAARALENRVQVLCAGTAADGVAGCAHADAAGHVVSQPLGEGAFMPVELADRVDARQNFAHRRPRLYQELVLADR